MSERSDERELNDEVEDPEVGLREEEEPEDEEARAQGPEDGEDEDNAGYGGEENYAGEEAEENREDRGDYDDPAREPAEDEEDIQEIDYNEKDDLEGEDDEDMYGEDNEKRRIRRAKKEKSEKRNRRKKIKREGGDDEAEEDKYAEDLEEMDRKPKKGKRKNRDEEEVDEGEVRRLVEEMDGAYEQDLMCFKMKQPALNKLKLLPTVEASLKRGAVQKSFIEFSVGGLDAIAKWLMKLPNGAPPSLQLKKRLVDIIYQLPVTDEHLKSSEIGKVIYGMRNNPNEDPDLKKTLKDIVDKWTRIITDLASDYNAFNEDIRDRKKIGISLDEYRQRSMSSLRKSIPKMTMKRSGFDFVRKPETTGGSMRSTNARQQANEECDKIIKDMKRRMKKELK